MSRHVEDAEPVPQFAKPLAPYIKSRQEALKIRRVLTLYLRNQVVFSEANAGSHLSLSTSYNVVGAKRTPKEITGLRREYLRAVQEHAAAKKEYDELVEEAANNKKKEAEPSAAAQRLGDGQELQTYRALLHDRRRREKLQIFHHYLEELDRKPTAHPNYLNIQGDQKPYSAPEDFGAQGNQGTGAQGGNGEDLDTIIHNLEKAVVRAQRKLDSEKKLLEGLKQSSEGKAGRRADKSPDPRVKIEALQRTRNELVGFVEEKLANYRPEEDDETGADELPNPARPLEEQKLEIKEHYEAYIEARQRLLASASMPPQPPRDPRDQKAEDKPHDTAGVQRRTCQGSLNILPYANDVLLPLYKTQKALGLQKSYISAIMAKEKSTMCRTLDRLNDESHLIPSYPILAKKPRFQHAVTAIKSRSPGDMTPEQSGVREDEVVGHAQAWAFASEAARGNTRDYIEQRLTLGSEAAENAEEVLKEVYDIMNQDHSETVHGPGEDKEEETDIWTTNVNRGKGRGRTEKPKGPWSGLNGKVGIV